MSAPITMPVMGLYDGPMWESVRARRMALQRCSACGTWQYPPGPACPACGSEHLASMPVSGRGLVLSWAVFHRRYLPYYPVPYNVVAVRLDEGPAMIGNLEPPLPDGSWIGHAARLVYVDRPDGLSIPNWLLATATDAAR